MTKKPKTRVEVFMIDASKYAEAVSSLETYRDSLQMLYDEYAQDEEAAQWALDDLNDQIETVEDMVNQFRSSVAQSILGNDGIYH